MFVFCCLSVHLSVCLFVCSLYNTILPVSLYFVSTGVSPCAETSYQPKCQSTGSTRTPRITASSGCFPVRNIYEVRRTFSCSYNEAAVNNRFGFIYQLLGREHVLFSQLFEEGESRQGLCYILNLLTNL